MVARQRAWERAQRWEEAKRRAMAPYWEGVYMRLAAQERLERERILAGQRRREMIAEPELHEVLWTVS